MTHQHKHQHAHGHSHHSSTRILFIAIIIILCYAAIEAFSGWHAGSLALLGDAGHMVSDALALGIAAFAAWIAKKPASKTHSYGMGRAEVLAAWISSLLLLMISIGIIVEAVERIDSPIKVHGITVMVVAFIGMIVNLFIATLLAKSDQTINIRAALLHVLSDLLGSFAALVAGAVVYFTKWYPIDPILSILIGILIVASSFRLLRESMRILMEGVPAHIDLDFVSEKLSTVPGVLNIHDLHIWTLSSGSIAISAHVNIHEISGWEIILKKLTQLLEDDFHIHHVTLQPEPDIFDCKPCR
ncbi:MAG: cation transporter [Gammaproteobacteria bacterium CG_4_10_14_0_8_um_filter_38_16]|nr:MAG: cation transporter [Gammaproteobacteria bacterium CG_4_10_14_0_8_um_filter_38_16]PJA02714.1 MAG: cation transporter [Gammaproteobacteria bacterium CG_4_10_14_0_2_um_filter_38_22]PJB09792.1 MAG: cation transporter [Gammaproteobacteria bacterium CG_4_9_14_3_um_filter_38_9]